MLLELLATWFPPDPEPAPPCPLLEVALLEAMTLDEDVADCELSATGSSYVQAYRIEMAMAARKCGKTYRCFIRPSVAHIERTCQIHGFPSTNRMRL